jgi:RNA polymerase sigma-70 factor (ECF subfamily)
MERDTPEFIRLLTDVQSIIESYVRVLVPNQAAARDIVQESNLTIWKKAEEFQMGTNFAAWAVRIAYFEVLKYRRSVGREKLVFDDDVVNLLADRNAELLDSSKEREAVLQECLQNLSAGNRSLLRQRYVDGTSVKRIAELQGKSQGSISQTLYRIRESLSACVTRKLRTVEGT